jgi:hypothetical protein
MDRPMNKHYERISELGFTVRAAKEREDAPGFLWNIYLFEKGVQQEESTAAAIVPVDLCDMSPYMSEESVLHDMLTAVDESALSAGLKLAADKAKELIARRYWPYAVEAVERFTTDRGVIVMDDRDESCAVIKAYFKTLSGDANMEIHFWASPNSENSIWVATIDPALVNHDCPWPVWQLTFGVPQPFSALVTARDKDCLGFLDELDLPGGSGAKSI